MFDSKKDFQKRQFSLQSDAGKSIVKKKRKWGDVWDVIGPYYEKMLEEREEQVQNMVEALFSDADERWHLAKDGEELASYGWPEVRLSVQWKANCYRDEDEVALVASGADALTQEAVIDRLVEDLRARGRIDERPDDDALARLLVEAYVRFPGA